MSTPPRSARRALAGLLLIGTVALGAGSPAAATETGPSQASESADPTACVTQSVETNTRSARAVFVGEVASIRRVERTDSQPGALFDHDVTISRLYKDPDQLASADVVVQTDHNPKACSLGKFVEGATYVFFVQGADTTWVATGAGGTALASPELVAKVERLLGSGRSAVPPPAESAEFTPVEVNEPESFRRMAAPGLALVLVGVLGLLVVGRMRRPAK